MFAFVASAGGSVGLLAGGVLTQSINWHWIFFVNLPIGIATALAARRLVPDEPRDRPARGRGRPRAVLITSALMLGVYTIVGPAAAKQGWGSAVAAAFGAGWIALLLAFLTRETRAASPLMPLRIFRSRTGRGSERDPDPVGRGDVRDVLPRRAVPAARARL